VAANAIFITTVFTLALALWLMGECRFLVPYRHLIFGQYGRALALFVGAFFLNVGALVYLTCRKVFLKDTGRKLAHLEKQLHTDAGISADLARRLRD
jgi:hypothetical protein